MLSRLVSSRLISSCLSPKFLPSYTASTVLAVRASETIHRVDLACCDASCIAMVSKLNIIYISICYYCQKNINSLYQFSESQSFLFSSYCKFCLLIRTFGDNQQILFSNSADRWRDLFKKKSNRSLYKKVHSDWSILTSKNQDDGK